MGTSSDQPDAEPVRMNEVEAYLYEAIATLEYIGHPVTRTEIAAVADLDDSTIDRTLKDLTDQGFLVQGDYGGEPAYEPARRAASSGLPPSPRLNQAVGRYDDWVASESLRTGNDLAERVAAARREVEANILRLDMARSRLQATRQRISAGRAERELLHDSAYARLAARLESQPVIEQAKGILMAQVGCTPDEAFSMLRTASQRTNVRLRDLARDIVDRAASRDHADGGPGRRS